jgi:hypothetical protein
MHLSGNISKIFEKSNSYKAASDSIKSRFVLMGVSTTEPFTISQEILFERARVIVPQPNDLLQEYLIVVDALTINEENRLRLQVRELLVKTDKLDELEQKMAKLDKMPGLE